MPETKTPSEMIDELYEMAVADLARDWPYTANGGNSKVEEYATMIVDLHRASQGKADPVNPGNLTALVLELIDAISSLPFGSAVLDLSPRDPLLDPPTKREPLTDTLVSVTRWVRQFRVVLAQVSQANKDLAYERNALVRQRTMIRAFLGLPADGAGQEIWDDL